MSGDSSEVGDVCQEAVVVQCEGHLPEHLPLRLDREIGRGPGDAGLPDSDDSLQPTLHHETVLPGS